MSNESNNTQGGLIKSLGSYSADRFMGVLYSLFITLSILLGYFFEFVVGLDGASYVLFVMGVALFFGYVGITGQIKIGNSFQNIITILSLLLLFISVPCWSGFHNVSLYFAIPIAYSVYTYCLPQVRKILIVILILSFFIAIKETITQQFFFVSTYKGTHELLTEEEGYIFRAKGLMPGVLILGQFSVFLTYLFPKKWWVAVVGLGCAMLAGSRSGMILISAIFLVRTKQYLNWKQSVLIIILLAAIIIGVGGVVDPRTFDRLTNVTNFDETNSGIDASNISRLFYWIAAIDHFIAYDLLHKITGDNSSYFSKLDNNPESGWLAVLVDTGLLGILFYLAIFVSLFVRCIRIKKWALLMEVVILFIGMIPFTINLSREGSLLFWLTIFTFIDQSKRYPSIGNASG